MCPVASTSIKLYKIVETHHVLKDGAGADTVSDRVSTLALFGGWHAADVETNDRVGPVWDPVSILSL